VHEADIGCHDVVVLIGVGLDVCRAAQHGYIPTTLAINLSQA
jgi:hypothetical protein